MAKKVLKEINWTSTLWLSFFLGFLGVDRFYMGKTKSGILKLITVGGLGFWYLIDLILIMTSHTFENIKWKFPKNKTIHIVAICLIILISIFSGSEPSDSSNDYGVYDKQSNEVSIITRNVSDFIPRRADIDAEWTINYEDSLESGDIFSCCQRYSDFCAESCASTKIYTFRYSKAEWGFAYVLKFNDSTDANSYYNNVVLNEKNNGVYKEINPSGLKDECFALAGGNSFERYKKGVICHNNNLVYIGEINSNYGNTGYYDDLAKIVYEKIEYYNKYEQ